MLLQVRDLENLPQKLLKLRSFTMKKGPKKSIFSKTKENQIKLLKLRSFTMKKQHDSQLRLSSPI